MFEKNNTSKVQNKQVSNELPYEGIQRTTANFNRTFLNVETGRSVKPSFHRGHYAAFRPNEAVPARQKEIMRMCMEAYDNIGLIRHIIDLMADFACQGMTIVHTNKSEENFYRQWFEQIKGHDRSERFLNYLYRIGTVAVRRYTAKISPQQVRRYKKRTVAKNEFDLPKVKKNDIPWSYEFLNPLVLDYKHDGPLNQDLQLVMNLTSRTYNGLLDNNKTPRDIRRQIKNGSKQIVLDSTKVRIFSYKKDDWLLWANPMMRPILDDITMLEKMKLADLAALDGAISNIRLWTMGDLEHKIMPKAPAMLKLRDILASHTGGGTMDLVWGPDLKFTESNSQVYKFLGAQKYEPVLNSIYMGMGIPPALTGTGGASVNNNHLSLKTLIERLEYGRNILLDFWMHEIRLVQKAMGFKKTPKIHFANIILSDEAAVRNLLINLVDRNIISHETLLERFNEIPEIEEFRLKSENKNRSEDPMFPPKASPYHNPQHKEDMAKIGITKDVLDVKEYFEQLGIPSQDPPPLPKGPGVDTQKPRVRKSDNGRPINTRDSGPRKQRRVIPKSDAQLITVWATQAQKEISDITTPIALSFFNKKNVRSLTKSEFDELEHFKLCILANIEPFIEITPELISNLLNSGLSLPKGFANLISDYKADFISNCKKEPSVDELRMLYSVAFAEIKQN